MPYESIKPFEIMRFLALFSLIIVGVAAGAPTS